MNEQPMSGPPKAKASEVTLKITAVKDGYIIRDGKTVSVATDGRELCTHLAFFTVDAWEDHKLGIEPDSEEPGVLNRDKKPDANL